MCKTQQRSFSSSDSAPPSSIYAACAETFLNQLICDFQIPMSDVMETLEQPLVSARNEPIGEGLINQPIGYFQIAADDFMDTLADMDYLLFDKYNYSVVDMSYSSFEKNQTAFGERSRTAFRFPYKHDTETQHPENIISADSVRPDDILMGQGQTHQMRAHRGNVIFRDLVDKHFFKYDSSTSKVQKTKISKTVVSYIAKKNGRFLEPYKLDCEGVIEWKHLGDDEARKKVAYTFRGIRKQKRRNNRRNIRFPPLSA